MRSRLIVDAMNTVNPTPAQKEKMRAVLEARLPAEKPRRRGEYQARAATNHWWTAIPAAAALIAVVLLGVFVIGRLDGGASLAKAGNQKLTLEKLVDSTAYRASMEVKAYVLGSEATEPEELPEAYRAYGCRTAEMAQKVDEICEKYGLTKVGSSISADSAGEMFASLGIRSMVASSENVQTTTSNASYSADGNFEFWGTTTMDDSLWTYPVEYRAYRAMKQTLSTAYWEIEDTESYEWWNCETKSGANVLIAAGRDNALLLTDTGDSVVLIVVMNATTGDAVYGKEALEAFADTFDFSLTPRTEDDPAPNENRNAIPEAFQPILAKYARAAEEHWNAETCIASDICGSLAALDIDGDYGYALLDLDGNGTQELLITNGYEIFDLYVTEADGGAGHLLMGGEKRSFLCKDNVLLSQFTNEENQTWYQYERLEGIDLNPVMTVIANADGSWAVGELARAMKGITEQEAREILDMYPVQSISFAPIPRENTESALPAAYQEVVNKYITAITEGWGGEECNAADISIVTRNFSSLGDVGYALRDLDGNGVEELLIATTSGEQVILDLYTLTDGVLAHVFSGWERNAYYLTTGDGIYNQGSGGAAVSYYTLYRLRGDRLTAEASVTFDADTDRENPWFQGDELKPITEAEAEDILNGWVKQTIEVTPLGADTQENPVSTDAMSAAYQSILDNYAQAIRERWDADACSAAGISYAAVSGCGTPETMGYVLRDMDLSGVMELLLVLDGDGQEVVQLTTFAEGEARTLYRKSADSYGCLYSTDTFWIRVSSDTGVTDDSYYLSGDTLEPVMTIGYDRASDSWYEDFGAGKQPISAEVANELLADISPDFYLATQPITVPFALPKFVASVDDPVLNDYLKTVNTAVYSVYATVDVNSDGKYELLLYDDYGLMEIVANVNGKAEVILRGTGYLYLCKDNVIEQQTGYTGGLTRQYFRLDGQNVKTVAYLWYQEENLQWYTSDDLTGSEESLVPISKDEQKEIVNTYPRVTTQTKPITELPMHRVLKEYLSGVDTSQFWEYGVQDVDGDGTGELLLFVGGNLTRIVTVRDGEAVPLLEGSCLYLCGSGRIEQWGEGAGGETRAYYRVENQKAVPEQTLVYQWNEDQWYRSVGSDGSLISISFEEQQQITDLYPRKDVPTMPISNIR